MTSTEETQALLPVTQADRDAAWPHRPDCYRHLDQQETWQNWNAGIYDHIPLLQAFARYRISHSLPGDVGTVVVEKIETVSGDFGTEPGEPFWRVRIGEQCADFDFELAARNFAAAIAALTSSPCPGDGK